MSNIDTFDGNLRLRRKRVQELEAEANRLRELLTLCQKGNRERNVAYKELLSFSVRQIVNSSLPTEVRMSKLQSFFNEFMCSKGKRKEEGGT